MVLLLNLESIAEHIKAARFVNFRHAHHLSMSSFFSISADELHQSGGKPHHLNDRMVAKKRTNDDGMDVAESSSPSPQLQHIEPHDRHQLIIANRRSRITEKLQKARDLVSQNQQIQLKQQELTKHQLVQHQIDVEKKRLELLSLHQCRNSETVSKAKLVASEHRKKTQEHLDEFKSKLVVKQQNSDMRRLIFQKIPRSKLMHETVLSAEVQRFIYSITKLQRWWRSCTLQPLLRHFIRHNLTLASSREMTFDVLMKKLGSAEVITDAWKVIQAIRRPLAATKSDARIFLSAYMVVLHVREIMPEEGEAETELKSMAEAILLEFDLLQSNPRRHLHSLSSRLSAYLDAFNRWKSGDSEKIIQGLEDHFLQLEQLWLTVQSQVDAEIEWKPKIRNQQKSIRAKLGRLGGKQALNNLELRVKLIPGTTETLEVDERKRADSVTKTKFPSASSPILPTSPHSFSPKPSPMLIDEQSPVEKSLNGFGELLSNEQMAHELALDPDFELTPPTLSPLEKQVKEMATKAFFDSIRAHISNENFTWVSGMVDSIRDALVSMLPEKGAVRARVQEVLDAQNIQQQVQHRIFDSPKFIEFVVASMLQLCAPIRDAAIKDIRSITDMASVFQKILELLDVMKLDLANFRLRALRPHLTQQSVDYERGKFRNALESSNVSLDRTRDWMTAAAHKLQEVAATRNPENIDIPENHVRYESIFTDAFLSLIFSPQAVQLSSLPETLIMDASRIFQFQNETQMLTIVCATFMLSRNFAPHLRDDRALTAHLKSQLMILLQDPQTTIDNLALLLITTLNDSLKSTNGALSLEQEALVKSMVDKTLSTKDKIFVLLNRRMQHALRGQIITGRYRRESLLNTGLEVVETELEKLSLKICLLAKHNREVYAPWYDEIISSVMSE